MGGTSGVRAEVLEREREREALRRALDRAADDGRGSVSVISAPAGMGKSTLVDLAVRDALERGLAVARVRGEQLQREYAFGVALELLEPMVRTGGGELAPLRGPAALALPLFDPTAAAAGTSADLFPLIRGLYWLAADQARRAPLVLAVDDAQWVDEPSLRFLLHLAQRIDDAPIAVVLAVRPGEPDAPYEVIDEIEAVATSSLALSPLTEPGVAALVWERMPRAETCFARGCFHATGGNPFLLVQLLAEAEGRAMEGSAEDAHELEKLAPGGVLRAITARLERLPPAARALARAGAILGEGTLHDIAQVAGLGLEEACAAADALAGAAILVSGEQLRFVHPLVRSSIYEGIPAAERGVRHLEAARQLAARGASAEAVAAQLARAHPAGLPWAVEQLRAAARAASAAGSPASAASYLRRALAEPPAAAVRPAVLRELARAEAASGQESAVGRLEEAIELTPDGPERAQFLGELGGILYGRGRLAEAAGAFDRALAELDGTDEALRLQLEAGWVTVARLQPHMRAEAVARMEPLLAIPTFGSTDAERVLLANVANQVVFAAEPRNRAIELARRALAGGTLILDDGAGAMTWLIAAGAIGWADELDEYAELAQVAVEEARRRGSVYRFAEAAYARSFASYYRGDLAAALADLELAIGAQRDGWEQFLEAAIGQHAWALVDRDEPDEAVRRVTQAIDRSTTRGAMLALLLEARARARLALGDASAALDDALEAGKLTEASLMPNPALIPWYGTAALAAAALGRRELALSTSDEEVALARRFGAPRVLGMALRTAGLVRGGSDGLELLREAVDVLRGSPARFELARALIALGGALRRGRSQIAAREPLKEGLDMAHRFGAHALERVAREELAASGARLRRPTASGVHALTPSEQRIARMAAEGLGNREIAQALFLTIRTVETHLTHAYMKLGIASRRDLAAALAPDGDGGAADRAPGF